MAGLRVIRISGSAEVATMPFTPPRVRSQRSSMLPTPVLTTSTEFDSRASVALPPPLKLTHSTFRFGTPRAAARDSMRWFASMM